jgi:hypothetical protein
MGYEHHDAFRDRLQALPLSAGRRGIAAMVLVEIVRWMPNAGFSCLKTAEQLGALLNLRPGDLLIALETLQSLGVIELVRQGPAATIITLKPMPLRKSPQQIQADIAQAIRAHAAWKRQLRCAIDTGCTDLVVEDIGREDVCEFGRWLNETPFLDGNQDEHLKVIRHLHAQFHRVAAATLQLALRGRKAEAERAMGAGGAYSRVSLRLTTALNGWRGSIAP